MVSSGPKDKKVDEMIIAKAAAKEQWFSFEYFPPRGE